jgi:hypothetical protein
MPTVAELARGSYSGDAAARSELPNTREDTMRFIRALVPLALAGVLLAGCGGNSDGNGSPGGTSGGTPASSAPADNGVAALEPKAIVDKAIAALEAAKSFSLKGDITTDGQKLGLDVKVSGDDLVGSITIDGAKVEILRVAGQAYIRPDEKFWTQNAGAAAGGTMAQLMGDRWAKLSSKDTDFKEFFQITEPAQLLKPDGTVTKGGTKTINGVKAIGVVQPGKDGGTLYVATTGEPYPLALEGQPGEGQLTFGDFGATFDDIKAPTAAEVVDLDKLTGK